MFFKSICLVILLGTCMAAGKLYESKNPPEVADRIPIPYVLTVHGKLKCEKRPGKEEGAQVTLMEEDTFVDTTMGVTFTDHFGDFTVSGWAVEEPYAGGLDPYLDVIYTCGGRQRKHRIPMESLPIAVPGYNFVVDVHTQILPED
ncbi:transthyretin-like family domain-containing protein [Ditylenchus destructor]|uniref:Transthyretin-like family domain-containing protein n=1 Tax=Ditylenchus destructor TaxID=166010 RepID=A0AAD4ML16_9BILA|nr:transthyretin-like family domain-containing protein [Ditylenchus destructor]